jgi:ABC-type nitrate/sulfonate/bicarbonate transport system permease component
MNSPKDTYLRRAVSPWSVWPVVTRQIAISPIQIGFFGVGSNPGVVIFFIFLITPKIRGNAVEI